MPFIEDRFDELKENIRSLNTILNHTQPLAALAYPLPRTSKGMESEIVKHITAPEYTGYEAIELATSCYQDLYIQPGYSQKIARRTVGVIWLSPTNNPTNITIPKLVEKINTAKADIENYIVATYKTRKDRFEALHAECPGVMTMHLYRKIRCYSDQNIQSVRFAWQRKDSLSKPVKKDLLLKIQEEFDRSGPEYRVPLQLLINRIKQTPGELLRVRRQVRVQPAANICFDVGAKTVTAPMPIIIIQGNEVKLKALTDFDAKSQRKIRSDKVVSEVIGSFGGVTIEVFSER
jgi:DNA replication terminus site-binding protein